MGMGKGEYESIDEGWYIVDLECPQCHTGAQVVAEVGAVLKCTSDGDGTLALRVKSKAAVHVCGQQQIHVDSFTGEMFDLRTAKGLYTGSAESGERL